MQERDAAVAEVVRREHRHGGGAAGAGDCRPQPARREACEHGRSEVAVLARHELDHGREHVRRRRHPSRSARLARLRGEAPAAARLVDVAPGQCLELADPHPGGVEHDDRQPVARGQEREHGLERVVGRRRELDELAPRQPDRDAIAGRIRGDAGVVENHRQHAERLADRLTREPCLVQLADEASDAPRVQAAELERAERGEGATDRDRVGGIRAGGDIEPRGAPRIRGCANGRRGRSAIGGAEALELGHAHRRELAGDPVAPSSRLPLRAEGAAVANV
jgi:hypothetical protein